MIRDGQPQTLVADTRAEVSFDDGEDLLRWEAGCNFFGGTVDITADRLLVQEMSGTEMGCPEALESQDRWLTGFFESGPNWELEDERLTLTSGPTVMELKPTDN